MTNIDTIQVKSNFNYNLDDWNEYLIKKIPEYNKELNTLYNQYKQSNLTMEEFIKQIPNDHITFIFKRMYFWRIDGLMFEKDIITWLNNKNMKVNEDYYIDYYKKIDGIIDLKSYKFILNIKRTEKTHIDTDYTQFWLNIDEYIDYNKKNILLFINKEYVHIYVYSDKWNKIKSVSLEEFKVYFETL